jgi:hypothetical protein
MLETGGTQNEREPHGVLSPNPVEVLSSLDSQVTRDCSCGRYVDDTGSPNLQRLGPPLATVNLLLAVEEAGPPAHLAILG